LASPPLATVDTVRAPALPPPSPWGKIRRGAKPLFDNRAPALPAQSPPGGGPEGAIEAPFGNLCDELELLERANLPRRVLVLALERIRDLRDVQVAARIGHDAVGRDELARLLAVEPAADPSEPRALARQDAHARAPVGHGGGV